MTREEKQKAIDALKKSAPFIVMTQEKYDDYVQIRNKIIELLEQEPCDDVISRKSIMERLNNAKMFFEYEGADIFDIGRKNGLINAMEIVADESSVYPKPKTERWIPVSERLPKPGEHIGNVDKYYLVQNEYGDMMVARYTHSEYWEQIYQFNPITDKIVAWKTLPEQYDWTAYSNICPFYENDCEAKDCCECESRNI